MSITITEHAHQRARERLNWSRASLERMVDRVFYFGIAVDQARGQVARYLASRETDDGGIVRAYGEHIFVFGTTAALADIALVTVFEVPLPLRSLLRKQRLVCAA